MALKLKKEIKKSSYYVWFLGAKESKGLRGTEYVLPVIENLEEREKDVEPFKVTLQVSHKGLKIVQNIVSQSGKSKPKNETIKHFIPHNTITCVHQKDDVIACILLLFNPVTKCPLHVHAYRCDSLETAALLKAQLQMLVERPENQKKFSEIENRLTRPQKEVKKFDSSIGSDTGTSTRESESSEERFSNDNTRVATLYDSVAAELRAKLNKNDVPILLPPRDYDTVHRQKGNLTGIELRRCLNSSIVGQNVKARRIESSGGSSGIGSDHAPSPESPDVNERYHGMDGHSTSDDDWNGDNDTSLYLMDTAPTITLHRANNRQEQERTVPDYRHPRPQFDPKVSKQHLEEHIRKKLAARAAMEEKYLERQTSLERHPKPAKRYPNERSRMERYTEEDKFNSFERYPREERIIPTKHVYEEEKYYKEKEVPVAKTRQKYYYEQEEEPERHKSKPRYKQEYYVEETLKKRPASSRQRSASPNFEEVKVSPRDRFKDAKEKFLLLERERLEQARKETPVVRERKHYYPEEEYKRTKEQHHEQPISPVHKEKPYIKRQQSMNYNNNDRYNFDSEKDRYFNEVPKPAPRSLHHTEEVRYRREAATPSDRYHRPATDKFDPKRRSMFNLNSDDHKRNSLEIAKELKRRSYLEHNDYYEKDQRQYYEEYEEKPQQRTLERDYNYSKSSHDLDQTGGKYVKNPKTKAPPAGYRNSYAEPKYRPEKQGKRLEVLHRTNSSVSNNGRVGIASVHPY